MWYVVPCAYPLNWNLCISSNDCTFQTFNAIKNKTKTFILLTCRPYGALFTMRSILLRTCRPSGAWSLSIAVFFFSIERVRELQGEFNSPLHFQIPKFSNFQIKQPVPSLSHMFFSTVPLRLYRLGYGRLMHRSLACVRFSEKYLQGGKAIRFCALRLPENLILPRRECF